MGDDRFSQAQFDNKTIAHPAEQDFQKFFSLELIRKRFFDKRLIPRRENKSIQNLVAVLDEILILEPARLAQGSLRGSRQNMGRQFIRTVFINKIIFNFLDG